MGKKTQKPKWDKSHTQEQTLRETSRVVEFAGQSK